MQDCAEPSQRRGHSQCTDFGGDAMTHGWLSLIPLCHMSLGKLMGKIHSLAHESSLPPQDIDMKTSPKFASESNSTAAGSAEDEVPLTLGMSRH